MTRYTKLGFQKYCKPSEFLGTPLIPKKREIEKKLQRQSQCSSMTYCTPSLTRQDQAIVESKEKGNRLKRRELDREWQPNEPSPSEVRHHKKLKREIVSQNVNVNIPTPGNLSPPCIPDLLNVPSTRTMCKHCGSHQHSTKKCKPNVNQGASADDDDMHTVVKKIEMARAQKKQQRESEKAGMGKKKVIYF